MMAGESEDPLTRPEPSKLRIVVGCDGEEQSRDALELARQLAEPIEAELTVAAVLTYDPLLPFDLDPYEAALAERFDQIFEFAAEQLAGESFECCRLTGPSPAGELSGLAERLEADLLIVGSSHRGRLGRIYPGSVTDSLLSGAPCPIAVAPRGFSDRVADSMKVIGVGFDARPEADAALGLAVELATRLRARLQLIAAVSYRLPIASEFAAPLDVRAVERERLETGVGDAASSASVERSETSVEDGYPADILVDWSDRVDLLVIGSRGYGPLRRVLLGGVGAQVVRRAGCPVIVVPRLAVGDPPQRTSAAAGPIEVEGR